jgi:hypothetical protein
MVTNDRRGPTVTLHSGEHREIGNNAENAATKISSLPSHRA